MSTKTTGREALLRPDQHGHAAVGYAELFFDLIYVFAITQLSHYLLAHHDLAGVLQSAVLFLTIWWAWNFMAWATNWLDPDRAVVRIVIFLVMLASLAMSSSLPKAFGERGLVFALAYLVMQIGRTAFLVWVLRRAQPDNSRNLSRATIWFLFSAPFWIWGALEPADTRLILWAIAIGINFLGPLMLFAVPGMGRSKTTDFHISGGHMAERCALLIIVALGEGILVTGATFADMKWTGPTVAAFLLAFLGTVAMWWIYFDLGAKRGAEHIEQHADAGAVARSAYTYLHIPIVAGIVLTAVADEVILAHPIGHVEPALLWSTIGGTGLFLTGTMLFKRATSDRPWLPFSHLVGLGLLVPLLLWGWLGHPQPLSFVASGVAILIVVAVWEWGSFHGGGWVARGLPVPRWVQERLAHRLNEADSGDIKIEQKTSKKT